MASPRLAHNVFIALCIYVFPVQAQMHDNACIRTTLGFSVAKRIKTDAELQHRRQNGFENSNLLDRNLMFSVRAWIHYQHKPWARLSASPFACYRHYKPIIYKSDETAGAAEELRFALAAELRPKIKERITVLYRLSLEYRLLNSYPSSIVRLRKRLGLMYRINEKLNTLAYDEIFMNVNGVNDRHVFDHNRIAIGFEYEIKPKLKLEGGYMYIIRLPLQGNNLLHENNIFLNFTYAINKS